MPLLADNTQSIFMKRFTMNHRLSDIAIPPTLVNQGEVYRHYKGGLYEIVCQAIQESDHAAIVVYRPLNRSDAVSAWTRPLDVFFETVEVEGQTVKRFTKI